MAKTSEEKLLKLKAKNRALQKELNSLKFWAKQKQIALDDMRESAFKRFMRLDTLDKLISAFYPEVYKDKRILNELKPSRRV